MSWTVIQESFSNQNILHIYYLPMPANPIMRRLIALS